MDWLPRKEYENLIEMFMFSCDIKKHLKSVKIGLYQMMQLICGSPISLYIKLEGLNTLLEFVSKKAERKQETAMIELAIVEISRALFAFSNVDDGLAYSLEDCWYDYDIKEQKHELFGIYPNGNLAIKAIRREKLVEEDVDSNELYPTWWQIKKWIKSSDIAEYTYYLIDDVIVYFSYKNEYSMNHREKRVFFERHMWSRSRQPYSANNIMELPISYKIGDSIALVPFPFCPKENGIIYYISETRDIVSVLSMDNTGKWFTGNLITGTYMNNFVMLDMVSPLYRLSNAVELCEEERMVFEKVKCICSDKNKSDKLKEIINNMEKGLSTFEVMEYLESI